MSTSRLRASSRAHPWAGRPATSRSRAPARALGRARQPGERGGRARPVPPARPRLVHTIEPPFLVHDVGFPGKERAWLTGGDRNELAIYETRTGRLCAAGRADAPPRASRFRSRPRLRDERSRRHAARALAQRHARRAKRRHPRRLVQRQLGMGCRVHAVARPRHPLRARPRAPASAGSAGSPRRPTTPASSSAPEVSAGRIG